MLKHILHPYLLLSTILLVISFVYNPLVDFWPRMTNMVAFVERRFVLVVLLPWVLCLSMLWSMRNAPDRSGVLFLFIILLVLAVAPAGLTSPAPRFVWIEPGLYLFYFMAIMSWGHSLWLSGQVYRVLQTALVLLTLGLLLYAVISVYMFVFSMQDRVERLDSIIPWGFLNIRYWSHLASWGLPLLPLAVIALPLGRFPLWCLGVCVAAAVWWWVLMLSMSRGSMGALLTIIILMPILFGRKAWPWLKWMLIFLASGVLLWVLFSVLVPYFIGLDVAQRPIKLSSAGRWPLWVEAWQMSLQRFPFGLGAFSWMLHAPLTPSYDASYLFGHPHNMYLFWAAEYGWWMVVCLVIVAVYLVKQWLHACKMMVNEKELLMPLIGLTASVSSAMLHAGVSSVFLMPASMLMGLVVVGLFWAWVHLPRVSKPQAFRTGSYRRYQKPISAVMLLALMVSSVFWQVAVVGHYRFVERDLSTPGARVIDRGAPRFWDNSHVPSVFKPGPAE